MIDDCLQKIQFVIQCTVVMRESEIWQERKAYLCIYHKVTSTNTSRLEPRTDIYRLLIKGKLDIYMCIGEKLISVTLINTRHFTVCYPSFSL